MSISLYRIDDRLVHGQVMTAWSKIFHTTRIIVVDEPTSKNTFLCDVMKMAIPSGCSVEILTTEEGVEAIKNDPADEKTIVLVKEPKTILALLENGVDIKELNVGNIGAGPGRKAVMRSTQLSKDEYAALKTLSEKGVHVYFQMLPEAKSVEFNKVKY